MLSVVPYEDRCVGMAKVGVMPPPPPALVEKLGEHVNVDAQQQQRQQQEQGKQDGGKEKFKGVRRERNGGEGEGVIQEAPVFYPTQEEFTDPLAYISRYVKD